MAKKISDQHSGLNVWRATISFEVGEHRMQSTLLILTNGSDVSLAETKVQSLLDEGDNVNPAIESIQSIGVITA